MSLSKCDLPFIMYSLIWLFSFVLRQIITESALTFPNLSRLWNFLILGSSSSVLGKDKSAYIKGFHNISNHKEKMEHRLSDLIICVKSHGTAWD